MPNLDYDPKNPTDLLDRPIKVGDIVAWGTTFGRSAAVCVARIDDILFKHLELGSYDTWEKCDQHEAEKYTLRLAPLKSTGSTTIPQKYHPNGYIDPATGQLAVNARSGGISHFEQLSDKPKVKTVHLVKNVVKLEPLA